jgi:hypothetical protein
MIFFSRIGSDGFTMGAIFIFYCYVLFLLLNIIEIDTLMGLRITAVGDAITKLNTARLQADTATPLQPFDRIALGAHHFFRFVLPGCAPPPRDPQQVRPNAFKCIFPLCDLLAFA